MDLTQSNLAEPKVHELDSRFVQQADRLAILNLQSLDINKQIMTAKPIRDRDRPPSSGAVENGPISTLTRTERLQVGRSIDHCLSHFNGKTVAKRHLLLQPTPPHADQKEAGRSAKSVKCRDGAERAGCSENLVDSLLDSLLDP